MNSTYNKRLLQYLLLCAVSIPGLVGCEIQGKAPIIENTVYMEETGMKSNIRKVFLLGTEPLNMEVTPRLSSPMGQDVKLSIGIDDETIKAFNEKNGTTYVALPKEAYTLSTDEVVIPAGKTSSPTKVFITVPPLSEELMSTTKPYALPLSIKSVSGGEVKPMTGSDRILYAIDFIRYPNVVGLGSFGWNYRKAKGTFPKPLTFSNFTIEFRLKMSNFNRNNQALFGGADPEIYIRYGDAPIPFNQLQVKFAGAEINSFKAAPDKWHHIAFTYDGADLKIYLNGELQNTLSNPGKSFTMNGIDIAGSGSQYFPAEAQFSEYRIWNVCRTVSEIKENFYAVDPKSPGLISYWKMDEGEGIVLHNSIEGAGDLQMVDGYNDPISDPKWFHKVKAQNESF